MLYWIVADARPRKPAFAALDTTNEGKCNHSTLHSQRGRHAHLSTSQPELGEANGIGEEDANDCHHGHSAIVELAFAVPRERVGVSAQAQGIKAAVSRCIPSGVRFVPNDCNDLSNIDTHGSKQLLLHN
jgi:hypothetical protein